MKPTRVNVTRDHLVLLRRMCVGWQDCETGAPEINPKRPYGNSSVEVDIAEMLGWDICPHEGLTDEQRHRARILHGDTEAVLQAVLQNLPDSIAGVYENVDKFRPYGTTYRKEEIL
jgi:hypothetical protein